MFNDPEEERTIALALSGGGSRAIAFHLGCLRALNRHGLLKHIKTVSSVSGGSVIAAAYCLDGEDFDAFEKRITAFLKSGLFKPTVKTAISPTGLYWVLSEIVLLGLYVLWSAIYLGLKAIRSLLLQFGISIWSGYRFRFPLRRPISRTPLIERTFDRLLKGATIGELPDVGPKLIINTTELTTGSAFRFSKTASGGWRFGQVVGEDIIVSHAVAAAAAYPLFLTHFQDRYHFRRKEGTEHKSAVSLTDGGVYDNLGLGPLWPDRSSDVSLNVDPSLHLVCCSTGYGLRADDHPTYWIGRMTQSFYTTFDRAQNASINRMHELKSSGKVEVLIFPYLGMRDNNLPERPADLVRREQVHAYPGSIASQALAPGFHELLRPTVVLALRNAFLAAQLSYAVFTTKASQNNPCLVFRGIPFARFAADILYRAICCVPLTFALLSHSSLLNSEDEPKSFP